MNLETFFEKFELFADAPDAVAKMRELVLELAVQGKLVEQRPEEDSARECIRKANKPLVDFAADDLVEVPVGWIALPLGCLIASNTGGGTPSKQNPSYWNGQIPWASVKDVQSEKYLVSTIDSITEEGLKGSSSNLIPPNRLIVVTRMGLGKLAINTIPIAINQDLRAIEPTTALDLDFAYLLFKSLKMIGSGVTVKGITVDKLHSMFVWVPPLAEQKRIVAKVDELMALCDRLEAQQQEREEQASQLARASLARFAEAPTPANLQFLFHSSFRIPTSDLRKSILTLAVQGKLVPQDPNDEPAAQFLERLDDVPKRTLRTKNTEENASEESSELKPLFKLPAGWEWAPFRRLPLQASVGIDRGRSMQGPDKAVGYFKMNNIRNTGGFDLSDLTRIDATSDEVEAFALDDGDFLFNTRNSRELVGKTCVFRPASNDPILYNNNILRVKFIEGFSPDFLDYWFRCPQGAAELERLKSNTTNVCAIYQGKLSDFVCVVPPLAEQHRIVARVEQLMALVDTLETQLAASRATAANLLAAIVAELTATQG
jgi:type I restriction enzyme S subunit